MTQIQRRLGDYAASKFLNSQDVVGQEGPAVITSVGEREVQDEKAPGGKRLAIMLTFDRWPDKGYDCNTTNIRVLQDMLGEDVRPDDLRGVRVYLTTHQTNFGRGILFQPPQDSMHDAAAAARQRIAVARERHENVDTRRQHNTQNVLRLVHSHDPDQACRAESCDVARAIQIGHPVDEVWPRPEDNAPPAPLQPEAFVPRHQPAVSHAAQRAEAQAAPPRTVGSGPQTRRIEPPHGASDAPPWQYHENDPGPSVAGPIPEDDIPF